MKFQNRALTIKEPSHLCWTRPVLEGNVLYPFYQDVRGDWQASFVLVSILNALVTQRLIYFTLSHNEAIALTQNDLNHHANQRYSINDAKRAIDALLESGVLRVLVAETNSTPTVYELINEDLLTVIDPSIDDLKANQA